MASVSESCTYSLVLRVQIKQGFLRAYSSSKMDEVVYLECTLHIGLGDVSAVPMKMLRVFVVAGVNIVTSVAEYLENVKVDNSGRGDAERVKSRTHWNWNLNYGLGRLEEAKRRAGMVSTRQRRKRCKRTLRTMLDNYGLLGEVESGMYGLHGLVLCQV